MKSRMLRGVGTGGMAILLISGLLAWSAVAQDAAPAAEADAAKPAAVVAEKPASMTPGLEQVARMYQAGITEEVLVTFIANSTNVYNVGADEILYLHGLGVSPTVLTALIQHEAAPDIAQRRQSAGAAAPLPRQFVLTQPGTNLYPSTSPLPTLESLFYGDGGAAMFPGQFPASTNASVSVPTLTQTVARVAYAYVPVVLAGDPAVAAEQPAPAPVYEGDNTIYSDTVYSDPGLSVAYAAPPYYPSYYYGGPNYYSSSCYNPWSWGWRASWYSCYRPWYYNSWAYSPSYCYSSWSPWYSSSYCAPSFGFGFNSYGTFSVGLAFGGWYGWGGWNSHHGDHHGHHDNHHGHNRDFVNTSTGGTRGNNIVRGGGRGIRDEIGKPIGSRPLVKDVNVRYEQPFTPEVRGPFVPTSRIGSEIAKNAAPAAKYASLAPKATAAPRAASAPGTRASSATTVGVPLTRPVSRPVASVSQSSRLAGESAKSAVTLDSTPATRTPAVNVRPATETPKQSGVAAVGKPAPGMTRPGVAPSTRTVASPIIITRSGATVPATTPGTRPLPGAPTTAGTAPTTRPVAPSNPAGRAPSSSPYSIARFDGAPARTAVSVPRTTMAVPGRSTAAPVYSAPSFRPSAAPVTRSAPSSAPVARSAPASAPAMRSSPAPTRSAPSAPASRPASSGSGGGGGRGIARN